MSKITLYRDDDISKFTDLTAFIKINNLFVKYGKIHTCIVEMKDLWDSRGIFHLLNTLPNIEIGLHCWEHIDYSQFNKEMKDKFNIEVADEYEAIVKNIKQCLDYWNASCIRGYGHTRIIRTFYPPWNRISANLEKAVRDCGLNLDYRLGKTLNNPVSNDDVLSFHWWEILDDMHLRELEKKLRC
jgi:peptidoglycan/xylan/chitin deacetylase (PgdA/CDA1 family)